MFGMKLCNGNIEVPFELWLTSAMVIISNGRLSVIINQFSASVPAKQIEWNCLMFVVLSPNRGKFTTYLHRAKEVSVAI
jgi:hypothetical protein